MIYGTGLEGGAVLAAFFVSTNLISRILRSQPHNGIDPKGDRRDARQVFANGAVAALGGAAGLIDTGLGLWLVTASLAAAAADTWATTVGCWSGVLPRLAWSSRPVPVGTSGGITAAGTAGAVLGALLVSGTAAVVSGMFILLPAGTLVGFLGMATDSTLGALIQGRFRCPTCNEASEWRLHHCGAATQCEGGFAWLNNDGVNFLATAFAAGTALALWYWLSPPP